MSEIAVQASFNSGEWAPSLNARVDLAKYRSGAARLFNFFVDYRGGASTRPGTKYIIQCYKSSSQVRLIPFQAASNVGYILEFGASYIRFIFDGAPVLEDSFNIAGVTLGTPCEVNVPANDFIPGDWVFIKDVGGTSQLNGRYFIVEQVVGTAVLLDSLIDIPIDSSGYSPYTGGGTIARIYVLPSPYDSTVDLRLIKFAVNINQMILCHPDFPTQVLTLITATNWTIVPIQIGASISAPVPNALTTVGSGPASFGYVVTSIDVNGQESSASPIPAALLGIQDIRTTPGSNKVYWEAVPGAVGYNVYESVPSYFGTIAPGVQFGFIGSATGTEFIDTNIGPDFSQTPPISQDPFTGNGVGSVTINVRGTYTAVPTVSFVGPATIIATGIPVLSINGIPTITTAGTGYAVGDIVQFANGIVMSVTSAPGGTVTGWVILSAGSIQSGNTPANPLHQTHTSGAGTGVTATAAWGVDHIIITSPGGGYDAPPAVAFSTGSASGTAILATQSNGNPTVPAFFQQRLVLAAPSGSPQTFYMSQPGLYYNFDISSPTQPNDSISGTLVSGVLNTIKSIVSSTAGMLVLTDKASWIVNGGSSGAAVSPSAIVANAQSFVGANDVPPIVANFDVLFVPSKGTGVRDMAYNIYFNTFTGTDITLLSTHLFFGHAIKEWAWAEQPFYIVWAVREDGIMLSLTFLKEQDFMGWAQHQTDNGLFKSVATVTEATTIETLVGGVPYGFSSGFSSGFFSGTSNIAQSPLGNLDAVYTVVERAVQDHDLQYIERIAERIFPNGAQDAWCVDSGLEYVGPAKSTFTGAEHLAGLPCTGLADGVVIPLFVMPANGEFTILNAASKVIVGRGFNCQLQTLQLDLGEPTVQDKVKKINGVNVRVSEALGLSIGQTFNGLRSMKDMIVGRVSTMLTGQAKQIVTGLVTGDAWESLDSSFNIPGQYCIEQSSPLPATILGVFPSYTIGDTRE